MITSWCSQEQVNCKPYFRSSIGHRMVTLHNWFQLWTLKRFPMFGVETFKELERFNVQRAFGTAHILARRGTGHQNQTCYLDQSFNYRMTGNHSNKIVFRHWFTQRCRKPSWADSKPQGAQEQGASNKTLWWSIGHCSAKLHVCEVCNACECFEVTRYVYLLLLKLRPLAEAPVILFSKLINIFGILLPKKPFSFWRK